MTSVSGNKDRAAVSARNRKYGMTEALSPTKSASFSPETWYRKAYEESRTGNRPAPEGAGSVPGSSGTPSPGSGTSSPGSFTGSPGPASPGIGTGSPGSLGGSPGFGTGSPCSGSGSSPGSDRGIWCENCNARLVELKGQALKLLIPGPFSSKGPSFSALIHDKLQVPNTTRKAWNEKDSRCDVCATHLNQLKQEAIQMVLTLEQAAALEQRDTSPGSPPPSNMPSLGGSRSMGGLQGHRDWSFIPASYTSPGYMSFQPGKHSSKPNSLGIEKKNGAPGHAGKASSPGNGNILGSGPIQAHQYLDGTWSMSRANGVTLYPYQISQVVTEKCREGLSEAVLNRYNADRPSQCSLSGSQNSYVSRVPSSGTSAAASFLARAAQKLNLSSKKKKHRPSPSYVCDPPLFPTNFSAILQSSPPPAPPCLLRAVNKVKDNPGLGKVKVMLRICPAPAGVTSESNSFLKVDPRKKQITLFDPATNGPQNTTRGSQVPPKMFAFDAVFPHDASQAEVSAGTVAEVIQSVVDGADGCVFCFGHTKLGKSYTMMGKDDSMQTLGIIPCSISWLFKLINERKEKTGARFSVRASAVEVWGKDEKLKDLLSEVATGSLQDGQSPGVYLCEDPICGMQLQNQSELRAPTAEKAAFFLDAAIASRRSSKPDCDEEEQRNSHMLFTLHVYQYRMDKSGKGGMSGGRSRLHLIDLGSCVKALGKSRDSGAGLCLSLSALGNVILALVNGSKHIPYKESKLTMLLRESLGNMNCRTTMIAHISAIASNFTETLSTIQIASRVLRMKKKKTKYTSSSSGGESSCEEGRMRRPTQLRTFHSRNVVDPDLPLLHLSSDPDYSSSSEQSCDTVIYVGPNGSALSDKELTDNEGPPDSVPIIPSLQKNKCEPGKQQPPEEKAENAGGKDCLKCNTFAELQERLECIDGSEEVSKFPFEEIPAQYTAKLLPKHEPVQTQGAEPQVSEAHITEQQQMKESVENGNVAQSNVQSMSAIICPSGNHSDLASSRSVTGSCSMQASSLQRAQSSTLHSSKESLNTNSSGETKPRPMGSPRLGVASLTKTSEYKPPSSPSQRCKVYTQKGVLPCPAPLPPQSLGKENGKSSTESLLEPEVRTSPMGMSPQVIKKSVAPISGSSAETTFSENQQPQPETKKEVNSTTTVTVQQPLELNGEDELVFTLVEELTISGVLENGRPASIISFNSDCSVQAMASGSRPVSIISSISEDPESYNSVATSTTATISEVSITKFLPIPKGEGEALTTNSRSSSISSWLSERSTGSDGEQSCHSFVTQPCYGQGESLAEPHLTDFPEGIQDECLLYLSGGKHSVADNLFAVAEKAAEKSCYNKASPLKNCQISTLGKTTVTISNVSSLGVSDGYMPIKTNVTVHPCIAVNPRVLQDLNQVSPAINLPQTVDNKVAVVPISNYIKFDDPWLKREDEDTKAVEVICEAKREKRSSDPVKVWNSIDRFSSSSGEAANSPVYSDSLRRVVDGCEMALSSSGSQSPIYSYEVLRTGSLPRGWHRLNRQEDPEDTSLGFLGAECSGIGAATSTPCSPSATLERRGALAKHCILAKPKGIPPLPPVRKSSLDQRNRASPLHNTSSSSQSQTLSFMGSIPDDLGSNGKLKGTNIESSSKLFSAKLEQLANRTNSLGRSHTGHYNCLSLERAESLTSVGSKSIFGRDSTMPRAGRSLSRASVSSPTGPSGASATPQSPKATQSKISAVSKLLLASPKARSMSASSTKTLSFSTKSLPQSVNRSSSLPPNGKNQISWSTQSLCRNRGSGLVSKLPLRAVNGRISELLQGSGASRASHVRGTSDSEERGGLPGDEKPVVHTLPSPYSKITAPRKPHRCSSGHGSDNSSVLSGELPPAMGKTALFYHSGGSSGYESMIRDSEATGSASSAQDSMSENSSSASGRRSLKNPKKRNNTGTQRRRLIPTLSLDATSPVRKPANSPGVRWVDGPLRPAQRGPTEPFEIKVYEIDDVERLQKRRGTGNQEVVYFSAKLKILENRQQRIAEVRARYDWLKKELEATKQHLMLEPEKWTSEFDLQQTFEVDSLEYLEALECVTERLESRVNFCKEHLMMITCFDVTSRHR
ncbi:kinesin-like protein KIF26B isoform X1 [Acipenser ruthenus]|uniref:kinesin-like protein KIF26B isoform X1 n=2 Tax=Acipenser ruthenus TaxID=7906 RepID=UPI002741B3FE|nr:kinesin-like protein KIF26B isoform X1 [Acipenser ruthenus]